MKLKFIFIRFISNKPLLYSSIFMFLSFICSIISCTIIFLLLLIGLGISFVQGNLYYPYGYILISVCPILLICIILLICTFMQICVIIYLCNRKKIEN